MQAGSPDTEAFGPLLRRLRIAAELSQEELADRARMSADAISMLERGRRRAPQRETVDLLIAALQPAPHDRAALLATANRARLRIVEAPGEVATHNLTPQLTQLIGREGAVAKVAALLEEARLVTVTGAGGIGKTRVALEVATQQLDRRADGVWLVELAALTDASLVAGTIALTVGELKHKRALLVLDNCEHLVEEVARTVAALLRECPNVTILATSREVLRVPGESVYRLPPLDDAAAVELFERRACAASAEFAMTAADAKTVADLCRRLDNLPLAIELAAARIPALAPQQLTSRLDERFAILAAGDRTAEPRQQTMQALIDWSYALLSYAERRVFRRLGVFSGGFTLAGAATVSGASSGDALTAVASLVDKSLVVAHPGDESRYTLLESIRAYTLAKLDETGERDEATRRYIAFIADLVAEIVQRPRAIARAALAVEMENVRSVLSWCVAHDDALDLGAPILADAATLYTQRLFTEYLERARYFLDRPDRVDPAVQGRLWLGISRRDVGKPALDAVERAIALLEKSGDRSATLPRAHFRRAQALVQQLRIPEALEANARALELHERLCPQDLSTLANGHHQRGFLFLQMHDDAAARDEYQKAADVYERIGDDDGGAYMRCNVADCYYREGDVATAERITRECLAVFRAEENWDGEAFVHCNLAEFALSTRDFQAAETSIAAALEASLQLDHDTWLAMSAFEASALAAHTGELASAARLFGYGRRWQKERAYEEAGDFGLQSSVEAMLAEGITNEECERLESEGATFAETAVADLIRSVLDGVRAAS